MVKPMPHPKRSASHTLLIKAWFQVLFIEEDIGGRELLKRIRGDVAKQTPTAETGARHEKGSL